LKPEYLRYYLSTKLNDRIEDLDINFDDFMQRVNADLVGKFINIASRCASFLHKYFEGKCSNTLADTTLFETFSKANISIAEKYEKREFSQAIRQIMALADLANQYIDEKKPWSAIKDTERQQEVHDVCTMGINLFRILMIYLKPVLPEIAKKAEEFLNVTPFAWSDSEKPLLNHTLNPFVPLAQRLEKTQMDALKAAAKEDIIQSS
jgi:methionyl-tRNA synthetase